MKYFYLVFAVIAGIALASAAPGMRGNGASGATKDIDPENPNSILRNSSGSDAYAMASGDKPAVSAYSEKKKGELYSIAHAENSEGAADAQISSRGSSSSAISSAPVGGSASASATSSRKKSSARGSSSGGSSSSSLAEVNMR